MSLLLMFRPKAGDGGPPPDPPPTQTAGSLYLRGVGR
jgi:hypothetical protein